MTDKYQWTATGMSITVVENGPMRYIRETDYDALEAELEAFKTAGWRSCQDHIIKPEHPCPICRIERMSEKADEIMQLIKGEQ